MPRSIYVTSHARKVTLIRQAKSRPCVDCVAQGNSGIWRIGQMELDHLPDYPKRMYLSLMNKLRQAMGDIPYSKFPIQEIIEEISHCEPVCRNHHAERTEMRSRGRWQQERAGQGVLTETMIASSSHHPWYELLLRHNPSIWD